MPTLTAPPWLRPGVESLVGRPSDGLGVTHTPKYQHRERQQKGIPSHSCLVFPHRRRSLKGTTREVQRRCWQLSCK